MKNDIFKKSSDEKNINIEKTEINKQQIEETQKKSVQNTSAVEKALKQEDNENEKKQSISHIYMKTASEKIKFEDMNGTPDNIEIQDTSYIRPVIPVTSENYSSFKGLSEKKESIIRDVSAENIVKDRNTVSSSIVRDTHQNSIVTVSEESLIKDTSDSIPHQTAELKNKSDNRLKQVYKEKSFKHKENNSSLPEEKQIGNSAISEKQQNPVSGDYSTSYSENAFKQSYSDSNVYNNSNAYDSNTYNNSTYDGLAEKEIDYSSSVKYVDGSENSLLKINSDNVKFDDRQLNVEFIPENSKQVKSENNFVRNENINAMSDNRFSQITKKKMMEQAHSDNANKETDFYSDSIREKTDFYTDSIKAETNFYADSIKEETNLYSNGIKEEVNFYSDSIKKEKTTYGNSIKEKNIDYIDNTKKENSILSQTRKNEVLEKNKTSKSNYQKENTEKGGTVVDRTTDYALNSAKNSDNTFLRTAGTAVVIAKEISDNKKAEKLKITKGNRRNLKINKEEVSKKAEMLGIKEEVANTLKKSVLESNHNAKMTINAVGTTIKKGIKAEISELSEDDGGLKGIDTAIKSYDTAKYIEKSVVNTGKSAVNGVKNIAAAPSKIKNGVQTLQKRVKKAQKFMRMSNARKLKYSGYAVKSGVKKLASAAKDKIITGAKSAFTKVAASFIIFFFIIIIVSAGAAAAIIASFVWRTNTPLDTTQMLKYCSELDCNRQSAWYKGKTGIEIDKYNYTHDKSSVDYHYLLAVDVPPEYTADGVVSTGAVECMVTVGTDSSGKSVKPSYKGFNKEFNSRDEMLENYRWTTDDYFALMAYLQVKNENLGWFSKTFELLKSNELKNTIKKIHELTYNQEIVIKNLISKKEPEYTFHKDIYKTSYSKDGSSDYYYFGRKFSVDYLIQNDMVKFDDDEEKNKKQKERYNYICKYGNVTSTILKFPIELEDGEKKTDRIVKHFGKQVILNYTPPTPPSDSKEKVWGKVSDDTAYHYANDITANSGDIILAPIDGLCKAAQRDERGFEFSICTSYNGNEFDFTQKGYLVKISCASTSFISTTEPTLVKKGKALGRVAANISANYNVPKTDNDTEYEDLFADKLFPCSTLTDYHSIGKNKFTIPKPTEDHLHIELYRLPCDFTNKSDIEKNVLASELFFDYGKEIEDKYTKTED